MAWSDFPNSADSAVLSVSHNRTGPVESDGRMACEEHMPRGADTEHLPDPVDPLWIPRPSKLPHLSPWFHEDCLLAQQEMADWGSRDPWESRKYSQVRSSKLTSHCLSRSPGSGKSRWAQDGPHDKSTWRLLHSCALLLPVGVWTLCTSQSGTLW